MNEAMPIFLPGVPEDRIRAIFGRAAGNEIESGKFGSRQSSAALAANGFGWFLDRPAELPMFPPLADLPGPVSSVEVEREIRFPWSGGRHPWLDAVVETASHVIGIESKRYEPFRDRKHAEFADAYERDVWGERMDRWCAMRDQLRAEPRLYRHLDAAQLVKHAFALGTEAARSGANPVLLYLYAEPAGDKAPTDAECLAHRREIDHFAAQVTGDRVRFAACSWRGWLATFHGDAAGHAERLIEAFNP
ncbi:MAG: hypothetical protein H6916_01415 [Novosphingobium sp.]|uniref:PGN_0703 family putative restriction endonuclease n=1 Tax=Novosphingobium sp. TaxID=1874826 RepID=UPI0026241C04|nr:hypothetical protein [Novosphingobium sp.]MCP5385462.1 hypothetical protein [Novosphingobium sp.]